ncbi:unnamed protein product [Orchesella dallaii]|uniref:DOMON domain-containing protein n=1 Tax=Orchesella dallaii TaxID=48710 RepID=A0ABP1S214_9HEXA
MPPNTSDFTVAGHCSDKCTTGMIPPTGVDILSAKLHGHFSARRMRLRHYRGNVELPWILNDQNYDFNYQQYRYLINPVSFLPGDQLTVECGLDNTWMNGSATVSGFSTRDEMCMGFIVLKKRIPYLYCSSEYPTERSLERFGIRNMTWDVIPHERVILSADDPRNVGRLFSEVVGNFSEWTPEQKLELEREQRYSEHVASCPNLRILGTIAYAASLLQTFAGGQIEIPLISESTPSTRTISSPFGFFKAEYPPGLSVYSPPQCPASQANSNTTPESNSNNSSGNAPTLPSSGNNIQIPSGRGLVIISVTGLLAQQVAQQSNSNGTSSFQRELNLDSNVSLILRWSIDRAARQIVLRVESEANGYIALGLTKRGYLENADVIILGVDNNGIPYLHDMHGVDNSTIREDETQNWQLLNGERSGERTIVTIPRALDTCDDRDVAFNQSLIMLVWDLGENHSVPTQLTVESKAPVYFWGTREYSLSNVGDLQSWRIARTFRIPPRHTSYWCTIHKRNASMSSKQHIVSMTPYFREDESKKYIHHQLLYRCSAPPGVEVHVRFLNHPGEECYLKDEIQLPSTLCREIVHTYGVGGEGAILPDQMGIPVGETQNEYYMFESHYDNPEMRSDIEVEHGVEFQSTPYLRSANASTTFSGQPRITLDIKQ